MATKKDSIDDYYEQKKGDKEDDKKDAPKGKSSKSGETRSYQIGSDPNNREDLTRAEAEEKGFFWGDVESHEVGRGLSPKATPGHESAK